jgi:polygalacturonase
MTTSYRSILTFLVAFLASSLHGAPATNISVRDFGALGDGNTIETAAIQKALDTVATNGGGQVRIPAGRYITGSLILKSHTTL